MTCENPFWFMPFIVAWLVPIMLLGLVLFTLWSGKFNARGNIYLRVEHPRKYWGAVCQFTLAALFSLGLAIFISPPFCA